MPELKMAVLRMLKTTARRTRWKDTCLETTPRVSPKVRTWSWSETRIMCDATSHSARRRCLAKAAMTPVSRLLIHTLPRSEATFGPCPTSGVFSTSQSSMRAQVTQDSECLCFPQREKAFLRCLISDAWQDSQLRPVYTITCSADRASCCREESRARRWN